MFHVLLNRALVRLHRARRWSNTLMYAVGDIVCCLECHATVPAHEANKTADGYVCEGQCTYDHILRVDRENRGSIDVGEM